MDATTMTVPEAAGIRGLRDRSYTGPEDLPSMMGIGRASRAAAGFAEFATLEGMANTYAHLTNCDPTRDVLIAELDEAPVEQLEFHRTLAEGEPEARERRR